MKMPGNHAVRVRSMERSRVRGIFPVRLNFLSHFLPQRTPTAQAPWLPCANVAGRAAIKSC